MNDKSKIKEILGDDVVQAFENNGVEITGVDNPKAGDYIYVGIYIPDKICDYEDVLTVSKNYMKYKGDGYTMSKALADEIKENPFSDYGIVRNCDHVFSGSDYRSFLVAEKESVEAQNKVFYNLEDNRRHIKDQIFEYAARISDILKDVYSDLEGDNLTLSPEITKILYNNGIAVDSIDDLADSVSVALAQRSDLSESCALPHIIVADSRDDFAEAFSKFACQFNEDDLGWNYISEFGNETELSLKEIVAEADKVKSSLLSAAKEMDSLEHSRKHQKETINLDK